MVSTDIDHESTIRDPILPAERIERMTTAGWWPDRVITGFFDAAVERHPDKVAVTTAR